MAKSPKYSARQLTEEDKDILCKVVFKYAITFYNLTQEYPNPKDYAKEIVSKAEQSDRYIGSSSYTSAY